MVSVEHEGSELKETKEVSLLYRFKKGSQKFYEKWEPTLLISAGILSTSFSTFGAGRSFESGNPLDTALFGVTALFWGSLTLSHLIQYNRRYNTFSEHTKVLQNELDKVHEVKRLNREKIHPHH